MQNIYGRLLELLGRSDNDGTFEKFVTDLSKGSGVIKIDHVEDSRGHVETFKQLGFSLCYSKVNGHFDSFSLHLADKSADDSELSMYTGDLPAGITKDDCPKDVEEKLKMNGVTSIQLVGDTDRRFDFDSVNHYNSPPCVLSFLFGFDKQRIRCVLVSYSPTLVQAV